MDVAAISSGLSLGDDGVWYSADRAVVSYPSDGHESFAAVEDQSFWFRHRNRCILAALEAYPPPGAVFDIGGGNGFVAAALANAGYDVVLVEPGERGARNAKARDVPNVVCATTEGAGFRVGAMPAMGLFDVIEHVEEDLGFLQEMKTLLANGGMLYATVPAYQWLWSDEDDHAGHKRRYTRDEICALLSNAGFEVVFASHFFRPLPLPILLMRALPYRFGRRTGPSRARAARDHANSNLAMALLAGEARRIRAAHPMSYGGSVLVIARA